MQKAMKKYNFALTLCTAITRVSRIAKTGTSFTCWLAENNTCITARNFTKWGPITTQQAVSSTTYMTETFCSYNWWSNFFKQEVLYRLTD